MTKKAWVYKQDIVIDCSAHRLPFEFVVKRRGANAVGKYGMSVARRWLESIDIHLDRHRVFLAKGRRSIRPDLFDQSTRIAYEVKTGQRGLSPRALLQLKGYGYALASRQANLVVYLNVAFDGRVGLSVPFREELRKRGFGLLILR